MKVADVMSKQVDYVTTETTVEQASLIIFGRGINGLPVCKGRKLVGFITEKDIVSEFFPSMQEYMEDPVHGRDFEEMEKKASEILALKTENIMSKNPTIITADTPLLRAQSLMFTKKVGRLPVVDKKGNLVGIISKSDIFRVLVGDKLLFTENADYNDWLSKTYYAAVDWENRLHYEMSDLLKVFNANKVKTIVDIGCGTGEHSIELARAGFTTIGIDRSKSMIKEANKRRNVLPDQTKQKVKFYEDDIENFLLKFRADFDCALFMGNTISHNPHSYQDLIKTMGEHLSENGIMILQITNFEKVLKAQKRLLSFNFARLEDAEEYAFLEFYDLPDKRDKTILKTFAILRSHGKRWKWVGVRNSLMAYSTKDSIKKTLKAAGFSHIQVYGSSFDGRSWDYLFRKPFKPLESDWLVVVAKKE